MRLRALFVLAVLVIAAFAACAPVATPAAAAPVAAPGHPAQLPALLDHQSTTGPLPAPGVTSLPARVQRVPPPQPVGLLDPFPAYLWRHGCAPTSVGMIVGYWDYLGWSNLIAGDPFIQGSPVSTATDPVNQSIASYSGNPLAGKHVEDYALYGGIDDSNMADPYTDLSQLGGAHASDCIADFMKTSWSSVGNQYGWSWDSDVDAAFAAWVQSRYPSATPGAATFRMSDWGKDTLSVMLLAPEIDSGHPLVALVDSDGDNDTDHFVTVAGYDPNTGEYLFYNTWDKVLHRATFQPMSSSYAWGVYSLHTFHPDDGVAPVSTLTSSDNLSLWHNHKVTLTFSAADEAGGSGVFSLFHKLDSGNWWTSSSREVSTAGAHTLSYNSVDRVGNWETTRTVKVRIDLRRPVTKVRYPVAARRNAYATLQYGVVDAAPSCGKVLISLKIRSLAGATVRSKTIGWKAAGPSVKWYKVRFKCSFPKGTYRCRVYARDAAGNPQRTVGSGTLTVK